VVTRIRPSTFTSRTMSSSAKLRYCSSVIHAGLLAGFLQHTR
jgi:hypothetical protein